VSDNQDQQQLAQGDDFISKGSPNLRQVEGIDHEVEIDDLAALSQLEENSAALKAEGHLNATQVGEIRESTEKARRAFRDLTDSQRKRLIQSRVNNAQKMMQSSLPGSIAIVKEIVIEHYELRNLFYQFVSFTDRAEVRMLISGDAIFGAENNRKRQAGLSEMINDFYVKSENALKAVNIIS